MILTIISYPTKKLRNLLGFFNNSIIELKKPIGFRK